MKKVLFAFALAGVFTACNNAADTEARAKDSLDSIQKLQKESVENAATDAKQNIDSTIEMKKDSVDSIHSGVDTANKK